MSFPPYFCPASILLSFIDKCITQLEVLILKFAVKYFLRSKIEAVPLFKLIIFIDKYSLILYYPMFLIIFQSQQKHEFQNIIS